MRINIDTKATVHIGDYSRGGRSRGAVVVKALDHDMCMTEFADMMGLCVRLVYYPPYPSKYNAIERYRAGLERSCNGYLLSTVEQMLNRAGNFCWKGLRTVASLVDCVYEKGVKICGTEKKDLEHRLERSSDLNWWDISIVLERYFYNFLLSK